jgi:hypothetical protein
MHSVVGLVILTAYGLNDCLHIFGWETAFELLDADMYVVSEL